MDVRCDNGILFGVIREGSLEVKCRSGRCGHEAGAVVIHRFDLTTGKLLGTQKFKDPSKRKKVNTDDRSSLRSA